MRLVIQRVKEAKVTVEGETTGAIQQGLLVLFGVHKDDQAEDTTWYAQKLTQLRLFADEQDKMNLSVQDVGGEILVVSQFTLYGTCTKGRRPEFTSAARGEVAQAIYHKFVEEVRGIMGKVETGRFAAKMEVTLVNDGPITLILERP